MNWNRRSWSRRSGRSVGASVGFLVIAAITAGNAAAQDSLRRVVYGKSTATEKKPAPARSAAPSKKTSGSSTRSKKAAVPATSKKRPGTNASTRRPVRRPGWITVTFESKQPNTKVFLNGNLVGSTDQDRKFEWTMTPGIYRTKGVNGTDIVFPERAVQLGKDGMTLLLHEEPAEKPPVINDVPLIIPKSEAEKEMDLAREMSERVIRIFADYLDPKRSSEVTTDDWRFAANAAVLGEFQKLSKQQIEAQRKFASGQANLADGNRSDAFAEFRLAVQSFPSSPLPHIGLGDAYYAAAQWQDARRSYEQARSVGPNFWMAHRRLGDTYRVTGERKKAVIAYADAVKFGDDRYETRFLWARALVDAENAGAAIPLLEELSKEKASAEVYLTLGEAFEMLKRDITALDNYRKAVDLDPNSAAAHYRLARIYYDQREYEKAIEEFDAALKLDGDNKSFSHEDAKEKRANASGRARSRSK